MSTVSIHQTRDFGDKDRSATCTTKRTRKMRSVHKRTRSLRIEPATMLDLSSDAILICQPSNLLITCSNQAAGQLLGYAQNELTGRYVGEVVRDGTIAEQIQKLAHGESSAEVSQLRGSVRTASECLVAVDGTVRQIAAVSGEPLIAIAFRATGVDDSCNKGVAAPSRDELTELPTRRGLMEYLRHLAEQGAKRSIPFAVLFIDLDGFKTVNDSCGHHVGDQVLACAADRLRACTRPNDLVARYGGDEFVIVLTGIERESDATGIVERIRETMREPMSGPDWTAQLSASVGVAFSAEAETNPELLIQFADRAMYQEKRKLSREVTTDVGNRR